jgi:folate-binding protein YgfZ
MSPAWYRFPAPVVFKVSGKDSRRYLNNRLSHDLRTSPPGSTLVAGALTPQGKVEGLFTVYVESDADFYLVCDGGERQPLFAALGRYIVADRVSILDCSGEAIVGHTTSIPAEINSEALGSKIFIAPRPRIGPSGSDFLIIPSNQATVEGLIAAHLGASISQTEYDLRRFSQNCPAFPSEVNSNIVLTEAGLREAVSFTKGCYVGQEVIERSDAIGKLPRHLERIVFDGQLRLTTESAILNVDNKPIGKIVSTYQDEKGRKTKAFALLKTGSYSHRDRIECGGITGRIVAMEERDT